jgi:hypothetical protein
MKIHKMPLLGRLVPTEDKPQMSRRTVLTFMAWGPIIFTAVVGVQTRISKPDWQFPAATESQEAVVYAYSPYVQKLHSLGNGDRLDQNAALSLANDWISAAEHGELKPLRPAFFEDRSEDGIKAEIINAQQELTSLLLIAAERGEGLSIDERAKFALTAMNLAETIKYSDFRTLYLANKEQSRAVGILAELAPTLDAATKDVVAKELNEAKVSFEKFDEVTRLARQQYAESKIRRGLEPLRIEEVQLAHNLANRITSTGEVSSLRRLYASNDSLPEYVTQLGIAWGSCQSHNSRVEKLLDTLDQPSQQ